MMSQRKLLITAFFQFTLIFSQAQEFNTWYFGVAAGMTFNPGGSTTPHSLKDGLNTANEGNSGICDSNGNILFYTNGVTVYNRKHQVMLNGSGLMGHQSAAQSSLIVPLPNSDSIFYIFTTDALENNFANGYRYSIININHDGGNGEVITKNSLLNPSCTERLTAARHANGIDVWIMTNEKKSDVFKCWLLTCNGLQPAPVISNTGFMIDNVGTGVMKASPDGKFLCQTNYADISVSFFRLFDFDNATGIISNPRAISNAETSYFGCEFSPDSKLLYLTRVFETFIDQFEVTPGSSSASINATRISLPASSGFYAIQTGPDGRIYLNHNKSKLSVITYPNIKGTGCGLVLDQVDLAGRLGALGLPNAINDEPIDPYNNFTYEVIDSCKASVQFTAFSNLAGAIQWSWDFGDGSTSNLQSPLHNFSSPNKIYNVKLVIESSSVCGRIVKGKYISAGGLSVNVDFDFAVKCDSGYVRFVNTSSIYPDNPVSYIWNFGDGDTSTEKNPVHTYANSGGFPVSLKMHAGPGCLNDSIVKSLNLQQLDIHTIPGTVQVDIGQTVQLGVSSGGSHFQWTPPTWLNNAAIANPIATPLDNITYKVVVTNDAGCVDEDSVSIKVSAPNDIYIPSAFTPNGDGKNDILKPYIGTKFTFQDLSIYNRWGQKVFMTKDDHGWNGSFNGQIQNNDVYVWVLHVKDKDGKLISKKGTVVLIK